jgi:hypothetical protein
MASSSSTPATLAPAAPPGPPPSSTLPATQAPTAPQGRALSPIRIATYSLGVYKEDACTSNFKRYEFEEKLNADLLNLLDAKSR